MGGAHSRRSMHNARALSVLLVAVVLDVAPGCSSSPDAPTDGAPTNQDGGASDAKAPGQSGGNEGGKGDTGTNPPPGDDDDDDAGPVSGWPDPNAGGGTPPDFGANVLILDPSMSKSDIQSALDKISTKQNIPPQQQGGGDYVYGAEFSKARYAILFKPGAYEADVKIGYYTQVIGLGHVPDDVTITGAVRSRSDWRTDDPGDALINFWRGAENMGVIPTLDSNTSIWAVSQATHLRRMHIHGPVALSDGGWSSGGYISDSKIDTEIRSGTQQQFLTRNTEFASWNGGSWNMVFVGDPKTPPARGPARRTPSSRRRRSSARSRSSSPRRTTITSWSPR